MIVNMEITCNVFLTSPLSGDLVQLGSTTVFRFNHPEELAEMKHYSEVGMLYIYSNAQTIYIC